MIKELLNDFLLNWSTNKAALQFQFDNNKIFNAEYRAQNHLTTEDAEYKQNKKSVKVSENPIASIILKTLPENVLRESNLLTEEYKIEGSVGKGNISEIPWICIFDKEITESAEKGYYIVFLIRADQSGFYLSLNQGWTQYEKAYKTLARKEIKSNANKLKKILKGIEGFSFSEIDLKGNSDLAKGYELGNICSKYYSRNSLPEDQVLVNDLRNMIGVYRELKTIVGEGILNLRLVLDEEEYQSNAQNAESKQLPPGRIPRKSKPSSTISLAWMRDPGIARKAIEEANYKCLNDLTHETFISEKTGQQFVEAHHLIPMEFQDDFIDSIDVPENIICLCPNCHRAFHNSIEAVKNELIAKFYENRKALLEDRGIIITLDQLKASYKIVAVADQV